MGASDDDRPAILYFGNDWFAENRTSSHQIARELAKRYTVHYFECPGLRAPGGSGRDLKKVFAKLAGFSSTTAKAILLLKTADRGISAQDLDNALRTYEKLQIATARRVLGFYRTRLKTRGAGQALAAAG